MKKFIDKNKLYSSLVELSVYPNYDNVLSTITNSTSYSYTATENCVIVGSMTQLTAKYPAQVKIDGVVRAWCGSNDANNITIPIFLPVKKGQTITVAANDKRSYSASIYGVN